MAVYISAFLRHIDIGLSQPNAPPTSYAALTQQSFLIPTQTYRPVFNHISRTFFFFSVSSNPKPQLIFFSFFFLSLPAKQDKKKEGKDEQLGISAFETRVGQRAMASTQAASIPAGMENFTVGLIGMGDMGRMYAEKLSEAGWR